MSSAQEMLKIERSVVLKAPRSRVWKALTQASQFSKWFGVEMNGEFEPGAKLTLVTTMEEYKGIRFPLWVERMEPERLISWRWHPGSAMPEVPDPAQMTEVVFTLEEIAGGTKLTVEETGWDRVKLENRAKAFQENTQGWEGQLGKLEKYVGGKT